MYKDYLKIKDYKVSQIDLINPIELYSKISKTSNSVLLVGKGDESNSQFSLIGNSPNVIVALSEDGLTFNDILIPEKEPWEFISELIGEFKVDELPFPINHCGYMGYLSYEMARTLEKLPKTTVDFYQIPMMKMLLFQEYYVFDNFKELAWKINFNYKKNRENELSTQKADCYSVMNLESENTRATYINKVNKIKKYIVAGDVYEVNLTQQVAGDFVGNTYSLFHKLYSINDAPYSCYFGFDDFQVISNSPELFLRGNGRQIETRPIKGTIKRSENPSEDKQNQTTLLSSEKDQAELYMIIDLLRNDLGKVSKIGSVRVTNPKKLEQYKNVYHLVGIVESELKENVNYIDLIKAAFPGGSITGCPKIRSMEIIDELETYSRNLYTGSIFWMNKNFLNSSIVIRTAIVKDGKIIINSGGAITIDSNPEDEYMEMKTKIKNIMEVLENDNIS